MGRQVDCLDRWDFSLAWLLPINCKDFQLEKFSLINFMVLLTSGHLLQQAFLSGRKATFSLHVSGGH